MVEPPFHQRTKEPYKRGGPCSTKAIKRNVIGRHLKALIRDDDDDSSDPALFVPTLKLQVQQLQLQVEQLKGELAKAKGKGKVAQEKSSGESRLANAHLTSAHVSAHELLKIMRKAFVMVLI